MNIKKKEKEGVMQVGKSFNQNQIIQIEQSIIGEKIKSFNDLLGIQGNDLDLSDEYMVGLYNGLILGLSIMTGEEPKFIQVVKKEDKK